MVKFSKEKLIYGWGFGWERDFGRNKVSFLWFSTEKGSGARVFGFDGKHVDFRVFFIPKTYVNIIYII